MPFKTYLNNVYPFQYHCYLINPIHISHKSTFKYQINLISKPLKFSFPRVTVLLLVAAFITSFFLFSTLMIHSVNATSNDGLNLGNKSKNTNNVKRIAFVEPTFTYAAYHYNSFYNFYDKYGPLRYSQDNITITTDLNLLKDRPIPHGPFPYYSHPSYSDIPYKNYFDLLLQHVKKNSTQVTNFTDVDVHQGKIFQNDGKNAYDILFLFHNEYLTQPEYNNLKQFVFNGGTIVFTEANILYAEVSYNKTNDSITLVNGHDFRFDGKAAHESINERWLNENKEWMGSNFLDIDSDIKIPFRNNPFNYTHAEEQYVTNPNAKILLDYQVYNIPKKFIDKYPHPIIATYEMNFGKGKIINLGIWGHRLVNNENFLNYFDKVIIPLAFDLPIKIAKGSSAAIPQCANYDSKLNIITVSCDTTLSGINHDINKRAVLEKDPYGAWILNASIVVNPKSKITINNTDTSWLKITNKNATEPNFISISGGAKIDRVKVTSWDPLFNNTIKQNANGSIPRPYIMAVNATGNVNISNSEVAFLGYNSYPSNGLVYERGAVGSSIINNTFHDMWDGFYSDHAGFISITNNIYHNNLRDGIDPHSGSHDFNISGNLAYNNSKIGINCSENCYNILFENNVVHNNGETGLMFSLQTNNSTIKKNYAYNEREGIDIFSSSNNKIYNNLLKSSDKGIFIGGNSSNNHIFSNTLLNTGMGIYFSNHPKNNLLENNLIQNVSSSIH